MPASGIGNAGNLLTTAADAAYALWKCVFAWRRGARALQGVRPKSAIRPKVSTIAARSAVKDSVAPATVLEPSVRLRDDSTWKRQSASARTQRGDDGDRRETAAIGRPHLVGPIPTEDPSGVNRPTKPTAGGYNLAVYPSDNNHQSDRGGLSSWLSGNDLRKEFAMLVRLAGTTNWPALAK